MFVHYFTNAIREKSVYGIIITILLDKYLRKGDVVDPTDVKNPALLSHIAESLRYMKKDYTD